MFTTYIVYNMKDEFLNAKSSKRLYLQSLWDNNIIRDNRNCLMVVGTITHITQY